MLKLLFISSALFMTSAFAKELTNETELGIASATGNTRTETYTFKQLNDYKWANNVIGFRSRYLNSKAGGIETGRYLLAGLRYENQISSKLGLFTGETFEKDRFANIDQRFITDVGARYRFIETELTKFATELGYRYMHEDRIDGSMAFSNYGRIYSEWEHKWNQNFSTKYWAEYLPNFDEQTDWQFNTEFSLWAALNEIFSLKTAYLVRYDHKPAPGVVYKSDTLLTTSLVAKF